MPRNPFQRLFGKSRPEDPTAVNLHLRQEATQLVNRHIDDIFAELNRNLDNSLRERHPPHPWVNSRIQPPQPGFGNSLPVFPPNAPMDWQQQQVAQPRVPVPPMVYMPYNEQPSAPTAPHIDMRGGRCAWGTRRPSTNQPDSSDSEAEAEDTWTWTDRRTGIQPTQHNPQSHAPAAPGTITRIQYPDPAWPFGPGPVPSEPPLPGLGGPASLVTNPNLPRPSNYVPALRPIPLPLHSDPTIRFREGLSPNVSSYQPQGHTKPVSYQKLKRRWFKLPIVASPLPMSDFRRDIPLPQIGSGHEGHKDDLSVSVPFAASPQAREGTSGPWFGNEAGSERRDPDTTGIRMTVRKVASTSTISSASVSETNMRDSVPYYIATLSHITNLIEGCKFQLGREFINQDRGRPGLQISLHQLGSIIMYRRQYGTLTDYDEVEKLKLRLRRLYARLMKPRLGIEDFYRVCDELEPVVNKWIDDLALLDGPQSLPPAPTPHEPKPVDGTAIPEIPGSPQTPEPHGPFLHVRHVPRGPSTPAANDEVDASQGRGAGQHSPTPKKDKMQSMSTCMSAVPCSFEIPDPSSSRQAANVGLEKLEFFDAGYSVAGTAKPDERIASAGRSKAKKPDLTPLGQPTSDASTK